MLSRTLKLTCAAVACSALLAVQVGCECGRTKACVTTVKAVSTPCETPCGPSERPAMASSDLPSTASPGECFAKVFIPPRTKTVSERVCIKEASERLEVIPAQYEWVEERVLVKAASCELEVVPEQYATRDRVIEVDPGHVDWHHQTGDACHTSNNESVGDVFCLVKSPPVKKTVQIEYTAKPATVREIPIPAEYTTVRRQVVKTPACTRRVTIPAEYTNVEKTIVCEGGRMEWRKVICETNATAAKINEVKSALIAKGYKAGPMNGSLTDQDWVAIKDFQAKNRLGVGALTYETLKQLGVVVQ